MAATSPTRADRQHRPRAAVGPSCRPSCPRRTPDCANRMGRSPGRRPHPPRGLWCGGPQRLVSYRSMTGQLVVRVMPSAPGLTRCRNAKTDPPPSSLALAEPGREAGCCRWMTGRRSVGCTGRRGCRSGRSPSCTGYRGTRCAMRCRLRGRRGISAARPGRSWMRPSRGSVSCWRCIRGCRRR